MLPLAILAVSWTCAGFLVGFLCDFPYGSWAGLLGFAVHLGLPGRAWTHLETPPRHGRFAELKTRFPNLGYSSCAAVHYGMAPAGPWLTRGFLEADLPHAELLEGLEGQLASRALRLPAGLRMTAASWGAWRLGGGPSAIDYFLRLLVSLARVLELPWRLARPATPSAEFLELTCRQPADVPPWLESYSWASPASRSEVRAWAGAAAAAGWRAGAPWPDVVPPRSPAWLLYLALGAGCLGAAITGAFGLPLLTWGVTRVLLTSWLFRPGRPRPLNEARRGPVRFEGRVHEELEGLVSTPGWHYLDDGARRLAVFGLPATVGDPTVTGTGWLQGDHLVLRGRWSTLAAGLLCTLFGGSMTALWWLGL